jgi:hypothetical protein
MVQKQNYDENFEKSKMPQPKHQSLKIEENKNKIEEEIKNEQINKIKNNYEEENKKK